MQNTDRDRCKPALAACCAALVLILACMGTATATLSAEYRVFPNGTAFNASIEVTVADHYEFSDIGMLGERIPHPAGEVRLYWDGSPCTFDWNGPSAITFERGNYTVSYIAAIRDNHLQTVYEKPYDVTVQLPEEFSVTNPLLAGISPGANVTRYADNTTIITLNATRSFDLRFYDKGREDLLFLFGNFWIIIAIVLLVPFAISMRQSE